MTSRHDSDDGLLAYLYRDTDLASPVYDWARYWIDNRAFLAAGHNVGAGDTRSGERVAERPARRLYLLRRISLPFGSRSAGSHRATNLRFSQASGGRPLARLVEDALWCERIGRAVEPVVGASA